MYILCSSIILFTLEIFKKFLYCKKELHLINKNYLNPIAACQTKAKSKKKTGTIGNISIIGLKTTYASGNRAKSKLSIIKTSIFKNK